MATMGYVVLRFMSQNDVKVCVVYISLLLVTYLCV